MENRSSSDELQNAIRLLEAEQSVKLKLMKEQFHLTYESLSPVNLIESTMKNIASSPYLIDNILGTLIGLATGYLSKKVVVGMSGSKLRRFFGAIMQLGVTKLVAQNPSVIKSFGKYIYHRISHKKRDQYN